MVARGEDRHHGAGGVHQWKISPESLDGQPVQFHQRRHLGERRDVVARLREERDAEKAALEHVEVEMVPALYQVAFEY